MGQYGQAKGSGRAVGVVAFVPRLSKGLPEECIGAETAQLRCMSMALSNACCKLQGGHV